jgi:hypothetical protein
VRGTPSGDHMVGNTLVLQFTDLDQMHSAANRAFDTRRQQADHVNATRGANLGVNVSGGPVFGFQ